MSDWKNYEKFLRGEYYPGAPKSAWRVETEAYFATKGISMESAPTVLMQKNPRRSNE